MVSTMEWKGIRQHWNGKESANIGTEKNPSTLGRKEIRQHWDGKESANIGTERNPPYWRRDKICLDEETTVQWKIHGAGALIHLL